MKKPLPPEGEPCDHPGCLSHVTHPCEGCGRTAGRFKGSGLLDPFDKRAADRMAAAIDHMTYTGGLDARSPAADARIDYGQPFDPKTAKAIFFDCKPVAEWSEGIVMKKLTPEETIKCHEMIDKCRPDRSSKLREIIVLPGILTDEAQQRMCDDLGIINPLAEPHRGIVDDEPSEDREPIIISRAGLHREPHHGLCLSCIHWLGNREKQHADIKADSACMYGPIGLVEHGECGKSPYEVEIYGHADYITFPANFGCILWEKRS